MSIDSIDIIEPLNLENWDPKGFRTLAQRVVNDFSQRHPTVKKHCERVSRLSAQLMEALGLPEFAIKEAEVAGALHDLGKINISAALLRKPDQLNETELRSIREIPLQSATLARLMGFSGDVQRAVSQRHERPDGRGYPYGISGDSISLVARAIAVADTFDSLVHDQPYRPSCSPIEAIGIIRSKSHYQFDPDVVDCFTTLILPPGRA